MKENNDRCAYITECKFEVVNVTKFRKISTGLAIGDVVVRSSLQTIGQPTCLVMFMQVPADMSRDFYYDDRQGSGPEIDTTTHSYNNEITFIDVYFKKANGTWKVAEAGGYHHIW
ncbi:MAG: hypothetical protein FWF88_10970 [Peptococcaceae bacterium]|nr:hypothetical protein [Peptococcaceae bacterium]